MQSNYLIFAISLLISFTCYTQTATMYIGTYTNGESQGIYKLDFNTETGTLSNKELAAATENPSFLAFTPNKKQLLAVGEGASSSLSSFKMNNDGSLTLINSQSSNGGGPCHVSVSELGNKAVVSNYGGGTISIYDIKKDGSINEASQVFNHNTGDKPARAHSAQFHKTDLYVADLGNNALFHYILKEQNYELQSSSIVSMKGNPGPRHFAVTNDDKFIYVINEYGGSIVSIEKTDSGFKQIDFDSTLSETYDGFNSCADIHLSADERFLYGSNRGENSIAVFKRDAVAGTIEKIQNISVEGDWPRNFTLDPTGKFLLVANQKSENISVFQINQKSGKLSFLHAIDMPSPVCLLFK